YAIAYGDNGAHVIYYLDVEEDYVVDGTATAKKVATGTSYLKDGTAVEDHAVWELPTDATALSGRISGTTMSASSVRARKSIRTQAIVDGVRTYSYSALADASADHAVIDALIDVGAFMQLPVHRGILFGAEAMVKLAIEGISDAPKIIVKALGSSGVSDPIDQRQSVGFKVDGFGLAIKRPEAICITYSIPKFAELAALSTKAISGDWTLMDERTLDDGDANHIATAGHQVLEVSGTNDPNAAAKTYAVDGKTSSGADNVIDTTLEENELDNGGNDAESNVK
ncbi:hypothetical protein, partial [Methanoculleus sp.]|uniref:hypothetical protein n=1 Tax=Methanoculleus sp. TaxID=90427 RepID=UPI0025F7A703